MSGTCDICRQRSGRHRFDAVSDGGLSPVLACDRCDRETRTRLSDGMDQRCVWCSAETSGGYALAEYGKAEPATGAICGACRRRIIFDEQATVYAGGAGE